MRYWAAFSQLRDSALTAAQSKELPAILDGTADYEINEFDELIQKNRLALEIMAKATLLPYCDWGLDYDLGADLPVEYAREGLSLGRLNLLHALQLMRRGDTDGAVQALVAGLRFSHDLANGGSLFPTIVAKSLLVGHLRLIVEVAEKHQLNTVQRSRLEKAVAGPRLQLNWPSAAKIDLDLLRRQYTQGSQETAALDQIETTYVAALNNESTAPSAELVLNRAPKKLTGVVPNLRGVLKAKQDLSDAIRQANSVLR